MQGFFTSAVVAMVLTGVPVAAQQPVPATRGAARIAARTSARATTVPRVLPGTRPDVFTTIQGNALTSTNGSLPNAMVRLRDARVGQIVDTQLTDKSGLFAFNTIDPGSYIIEIINGDQVLAASQLLNVNAGEAVSAVVKLPFRIPPFAGVLGNSTPSAAAVTTQAATSGVLAIKVNEAAQESANH
jgi:hypothetical protein